MQLTGAAHAYLFMVLMIARAAAFHILLNRFQLKRFATRSQEGP
jgi:hypothetical protein